jgi:hypothetical protein
MIRKLELARRRKDTRIQNPPEFFMKQKNPANFQGTTDMLAIISCTLLFNISSMSQSIKISLKFPTGTFRRALKNLRELTKLIKICQSFIRIFLQGIPIIFWIAPPTAKNPLSKCLELWRKGGWLTITF